MVSDVNAVYDQVAELYAATFRDVRLRLFEWPWIRARLRELAPERVLDLGCGNGYLSAELVRSIPQVSAIDPSEALLQHARQRLPAHARVYHGSAESLPFADASFDAVVSLLSFRYTDQPAAAREVARVLAPGGQLILVDFFAHCGTLRRWDRLRAWTALAARAQMLARPRYTTRLRRLTRDPAWRAMVASHPRRSAAEADAALGAVLEAVENRRLSSTGKGETRGLCYRRATAATR